MAELSALDLFKAGDLNYPEDVAKALGMKPEAQVQKLNGAYEVKFQDLKVKNNNDFGRFEKLEVLHKAFLQVKEFGEKVIDPSLWEKYSAHLSEAQKECVEVHSVGPECDFRLEIKSLAKQNVAPHTKAVDALSRYLPMGLANGVLTFNNVDIEIHPSLSLNEIAARMNGAWNEFLRVNVMEVKPPENATPGKYQLFFHFKGVETFDWVDDQQGALLDSLGIDAAQMRIQKTPASFLVNDIPLERPTNQIEGVLEGVTLTLKKPTSEPFDIEVSREKNIIKHLLLGFVKALSEYEALQKEHAPLEERGAHALGHLSFLRQFLTDFKLLSAQFFDEKSRSFVGIKEMGGVWVLDEEAFDLIAQDMEKVRMVVFGETSAVEDVESTPSLKGFIKSLGNLERSFAEALQKIEGKIKGHQAEVARMQQRIDKEKAKMRKGLPKLQEAAQAAKMQEKLSEQMMESLFNASSGAYKK